MPREDSVLATPRRLRPDGGRGRPRGLDPAAGDAGGPAAGAGGHPGGLVGREGGARRRLRAAGMPGVRPARRVGHLGRGGLVRCARIGLGRGHRGAPFCLDHLVAGGPAALPAVVAARGGLPAGAAADLRDRLERFAHTTAHDRRHLQTEDQRASVDEAADLLGGEAAAEG